MKCSVWRISTDVEKNKIFADSIMNEIMSKGLMFIAECIGGYCSWTVAVPEGMQLGFMNNYGNKF